MEYNEGFEKGVLSKTSRKMRLECILLGLIPLFGMMAGILIYIFMRYGTS